jgi:hypothetical protein
MPSPWLWERRDERGPVGALARWWGGRRVRAVSAALERHGDVPPKHRAETSRM